jgi:5-formyltetrahydrofolate cyclo-ligase
VRLPEEKLARVFGGVNKSELRAVVLGRLRATPAPELAAHSDRICRRLAALPLWRQARTVAAFLPMAREPQIQPLWRAEGGPVFCFPQVRGADVVLLRVEDRLLLEDADWKLEAPAFSTCPEVPPGELDAILVPGVAFTRDGRRLGRGGGYYDRLLASCAPRTARIGVCFECQIVPELPAEPHDQQVAMVVTEAGPGMIVQGSLRE